MASKDQVNNAQELNRLFSELTKLSEELENTFSSISSNIGKAARSTQDFTGEFRVAKRDAQDIVNTANKLAKARKSDLTDSRKRANLEKTYSDLLRKREKVESTISFLSRLRANATEAEKKELDKVVEDLSKGADLAGETLGTFESIEDSITNIDKSTDFVKKLADGIKDIPGIGPLLAGPLDSLIEGITQFKIGIDETEDEAENLRQELERINNVLDAAAKGIATFALTGLFKANTSSIELAKNLGVSREEAEQLRSSFNTISINSGKSYLNAEAFASALGQVGDELGAVSGFTTEQLQSQIELTKLVGLQGDEAAKLIRYGIVQNKTQNELTTEILDQVVALEQQTGIQLKGQKVLAEVARVNGQLGAQYGYNTQEIARAVVQANRLGLSLEETQGIAKNLLDFEQSITNELQAELLLGRDLNLEQARLLALQGDSAGAAAELAKQFGTAEEFSRLNVIQQESLASAVGMGVDELANSIKQQEVLNSLGAKNIEQLAEQGRLDELRSVKNGDILLKNFQQQSAAEKFQDAMTRIQSAIGSIVEGPLGNLIDMMANAANSAGVLYTTLGLMGAISLGRTIGGLASMALQLNLASVGAITTASAVTFGLGLAAIVAGIAYMTSQSKKAQQELATVDDMVMPAGYGDRILSTPKGQIALNDNDTVVAGTNLNQGSNEETKRTNMLLERLITQNSDKPRLSPVGLYEVQ
jgi:hypothetical protein